MDFRCTKLYNKDERIVIVDVEIICEDGNILRDMDGLFVRYLVNFNDPRDNNRHPITEGHSYSYINECTEKAQSIVNNKDYEEAGWKLINGNWV